MFNENLLTDNSLKNTESKRYKIDKFSNTNKNLLYPTTEQSTQSQRKVLKAENSFKNYIKNNHLENDNSMPRYYPGNQNDISKSQNFSGKIYMNNYKPKNKKFKVFRNEDDITKYFSKNYKKNKTKNNNDNILNDFDTNNSKKNNIFYLINDNNSAYNYKLKNMRNNNKNNINDIYNKDYKNRKNQEQKISKISLPFCIYNYPCIGKKCPGCRYCLGLDYPNDKNNNTNDNILNTLNNSLDDNHTGNFTPNFLKLNGSNDKIPRNNIIEDNVEESENENETEIIEIDSSIGTELSKKGDRSVHCLINIIKFPNELNMNDEDNLLNKNGTKKKSTKDIGDKQNNSNDDDSQNNLNDPKKQYKSRSEPKNNHDRSSRLRKIKKIELLRDFDFE